MPRSRPACLLRPDRCCPVPTSGRLGCEGIVSKRIDAHYTSGPSSIWLNTKHATVGIFPVVGYVPDGFRVEALLVAECPSMRRVGRVLPPRRAGTMIFCGTLRFLTRPKPFILITPLGRGVRWVEPGSSRR